MGRRHRSRFLAALAAVVLVAACAALSAPLWAQGTAADEHRITLDLRDANIEDALRMIFRDTPYSFTIEPDVTGKVTLSLNEVPFARALRAILDINNPKLTYRKEAGDLYVITKQTAEPEPREPAPGTQVIQPSPEQTVYWIGPGGRYQLQYLDCRDVAVWFGGTIIGGTPQYPFGMGGGGGGGGGIGGGGLGGGGLGGNSGGLGGGYGGGGGGGGLGGGGGGGLGGGGGGGFGGGGGGRSGGGGGGGGRGGGGGGSGGGGGGRGGSGGGGGRRG